MSVEQTINFSDDTFLYYEIKNRSNNYTLRFDGNNKDINIVLNKGQFEELVQRLVDDESIVIDENGEIKVEV